MARPTTWATDHGHTPCRGGRPRPAPLQGRSATAKALYRGRHLQKAAARDTLVRGDQPVRANRQRPIGAAAPTARVAAPW
ncbi:hypothetical protein B296_00046051 [Ensete ventricosum]|uniref:Uncharacterized protein n=1 Tax=Ensete ventricosum TaxID=4639 RepID=A0A426Y544_ENSVE|nr:hypothetical protein B296_00046051 [Ensete ventricosum]